jgi:hypothetical protein
VKNLIICIDGTTNATEVAPDDPTPTNVLLFARALALRDGATAPQIVDYIRGVGTDVSAGYAGRTLASARGTGLSQIVQNAYEFLTNNYEGDDYVYILGFSRGAAAARSLSGLTELFGVLPKPLMSMFPVAWKYYNTPPQERSLKDLAFKDNNLFRIAERGEALRAAHIEECQTNREWPLDPLEQYPHAPIFQPRRDLGPLRLGAQDWEYVAMPLHFVGVWDTVFHADSEGFHESRLAWNVGSAYQALAIHEVRDAFPPVLWMEKCRHQLVRQTWFTGSHSDVGGGNGNLGLSSITLDWMIKRTLSDPHVRPGHALVFDPAFLKMTLRPKHGPMTYPQDDTTWRLLGQSVRKMGGQWHGEDLQFRSPSANPDAFLYKGVRTESLLQDADTASKTLPPEP